MNVCDAIASPLVRAIGLKNVELNFLYDNLVPGTCLLVGEGNEGGHEGVSAAALHNQTVTRPIDCVDIFPYRPDSFIQQQEAAGTLRFFQRDFITQPEDVQYDNVGCINVLEHFGFVGMTDDLISINHDLKGIAKMLAVCRRRIILTIPFGFRLFTDDGQVPRGRYYTWERMELIANLCATHGFGITKDYTVANTNFTPEIHDISRQHLEVERRQSVSREYLKLLQIDRISST